MSRGCCSFDPSTRAPASLDFARDQLAGGASLGMSPHTRRGVVLSERSESKDDDNGAPGLPGGLHDAEQMAAPAADSGEGRSKREEVPVGRLG